MRYLNCIPELTKDRIENIKWCQTKYLLNISKPLYNFASFKGVSNMNKITGDLLAGTGLCLINVEVISESFSKNVLAMIDTGASNSMIKKSLAD